MKCLNTKCENELPEGIRSTRKFCSDACRQAYFRQQQKQDQAHGHTFTEMLSELVELREKVHNQEKTIAELGIEKAELTSEVSRLYHRLNVEQRFVEDKEKLPFKVWLKKQASPLKEKLCTDEYYSQLRSRETRRYYDYRLRVHWHCTEEEMEEFARLWKLLLLQS
jgi:hypothetical protein